MKTEYENYGRRIKIMPAMQHRLYDHDNIIGLKMATSI